MNDSKRIEGIIKNSNQFQHLKFELINKEHVVSLIDSDGYEIVRGYDNTVIETLNDMHSNLP